MQIMSEVALCQDVTINWHPHMGDGSLAPDIPLATIRGCIEPSADNPLTLFLVGLGEERASAEAAINYWEGEYGLPAAAAWLCYRALPVNEANLTRIAVEAPLVIAEHHVGNNPVHLVTNSLGCLGVNAAAEAPDNFLSVASLAPYALANEYKGRVPLLGAPLLTRAATLGVNLGVRTLLQHWQNRHDPNMKAVVQTTFADARQFGLRDYRTALDTALSAKIGRRTAESYVSLASSRHREYLGVGDSDRLVHAGHMRAALGEAAARLEVDPAVVAGLVHELSGPHSPLFSEHGLDQLSRIADWLVKA
jgi:hypothetical protein